MGIKGDWRRRISVLGGAMAALLLGLSVLSGCSASSSPTDEEQSERPTKAEYMAAVDATRKCMEEKGFTFEVSETETGQMIHGVDGGDPVAAAERYRECATKYLDEIESAYLKPEVLTGEAREAAMQKLVDCLAESGIPGLDPATTDSRVFVNRVFSDEISDEQLGKAYQCLELYRGVWPPGDVNNP